MNNHLDICWCRDCEPERRQEQLGRLEEAKRTDPAWYAVEYRRYMESRDFRWLVYESDKPEGIFVCRECPRATVCGENKGCLEGRT